MGWGRMVNSPYILGDRLRAGAHSKILQKLKMSLINNEKCKSVVHNYKNITNDKQVCASTGRTGNIIVRGS